MLLIGAILKAMVNLQERVSYLEAAITSSNAAAAVDPNARGGEFYGPLFVNNGPPVRKPIFRLGMESAIAKLWEVSTRETGIPLEVGAG